MTTRPPLSERIEYAAAYNEFGELTHDERAKYRARVCETIGLDSLTSGLQWVKLDGRLTLYATRQTCEQLARVHGLSIEIVSADSLDGVYVVNVRVSDGKRSIQNIGVKELPGEDDKYYNKPAADGSRRLRNVGKERSNAMMHAMTKGMRRGVLSWFGIGLDETEVEDIEGAVKVDAIAGAAAKPAPETPKPDVLGEIAAGKMAHFADNCGTTVAEIREHLEASGFKDLPANPAEWPEKTRVPAGAFCKARKLELEQGPAEPAEDPEVLA